MSRVTLNSPDDLVKPIKNGDAWAPAISQFFRLGLELGALNCMGATKPTRVTGFDTATVGTATSSLTGMTVDGWTVGSILSVATLKSMMHADKASSTTTDKDPLT